jgi:ABC-type glycerol-3-phosphate transport system substrate-binding protein
MPRKAVAIYLILALLGAALFIFFTFPRTKDQIPTSNNQRPFDQAPAPGPGNVPAPATPAPQHGPTLHVMAWASPSEAQALSDRLDAYTAQTGWNASLTLANDEETYRHDLPSALASDAAPDVCLINARDFSGTVPARDLASVPPDHADAARSITAFTVDGGVRATPAEFSVDLLFYNPSAFDRAGIAAPGPHWNWDVLEAMSRALAALKLKTAKGDVIYPLELPADFDFWNVLCTQAGHPALDAGTWHVADASGRDAEMRSLDFIHVFFQGLSVTAPLPASGVSAGRYFGAQRSAMLIGPSDLVASLPNFGYQVTQLPRDMCNASLAHVDGWAVSARSSQPQAAQALAAWLAQQPLHAGWTSPRLDVAQDGFSQICQAALTSAVIPRITPRDTALAQFLDEQIDQLARNSDDNSGQIYARIQAEYLNEFPDSAPKPSEKATTHTASTTGESRDM